MSDSKGKDPILAEFFANALTTVGFLVIGLGGLCTFIFGAMALNPDHEFRIAPEDWMVPGTMLAFGSACVLIGRALRPKPPKSGDDADA